MDVFIQGFVSGTVQSVIGHPLDTIKTRLQVGQPFFPVSTLYKGFLPSLLGGCLQNGFLFALEEKSQRVLSENKLVSGFSSGILTSFFVSPLEQWKCRIQTGVGSRPSLFKGLGSTMARDGIGFAGYFYVYDSLRPHCSIFWAGGLAGIASWIMSYPIDVYKTKQQLQLKHAKCCPLGLAVVSTRAFFVNGSLFYVFEHIDPKNIVV